MALITCSECGGKISTQAHACPTCGAPQKALPANIGSEAKTDSRSESTIVQVAPEFENEKIKEMQLFGWNLQSRQEIHEEGDAYGRPSYINSSVYVVKTQVFHYVKLHFSRNLELDHLDDIRKVEAEYFALQFPSQATLVWPILFIVFFCLFVVFGLAVVSTQGASALPTFVIYCIPAMLSVMWLKRRIAQNRKNVLTCLENEKRLDVLKVRIGELTRH